MTSRSPHPLDPTTASDSPVPRSSGSSPVPLPTPSTAIGRIPVIEVGPVLENGRWPAKATVDEAIEIVATVFREGHDAVAATAVLIAPDGSEHTHAPMVDVAPGLDQFCATVVPDCPGDWTFRVEAWSDPYATWSHAARVKIGAGVDVELMLAEGVALFDQIRTHGTRTDAEHRTLKDAMAALADTTRPPEARLAPALSPEVHAVLARTPLRQHVTESATYPLRVDRSLALSGAWYEMFPRSYGAVQRPDGTWISGTFDAAAQRLPQIAAMGFDVVYLTPIHPIGMTHRKGRNNTLTTQPGDPGSPYAIGSPEGGHDAIHPELGTEGDFGRFVAHARSHGLEVAIDLALQCSPDHPWVREHPQWFTTRTDGSIAYAENPPKKYQDIVPLNFDNDPSGIYAEILRVVRVWIERGVTAFRVDNPHTKPLDFWQWLLDEVRRTNPEVIFLSEAFTKPAMMATLGRIGFHQSYTYFTWRNTKSELAEYLIEVSSARSAATMRPSFWPTTHDILPPYLSNGGVAAWAVRAVLAALGSPTWGIYSGYELVESVPRPGAEEQIDNEKYEFKPRNWAAADDIGIATLLTRLNAIRRAHPALRQLRNLHVHPTTNDHILAFSRHLPATSSPTGTSDTVVIVVNLDPHQPQDSIVHLDMTALGLAEDSAFIVHDALSGQSYTWQREAYVRLDPGYHVAHALVVESSML